MEIHDVLKALEEGKTLESLVGLKIDKTKGSESSATQVKIVDTKKQIHNRWKAIEDALASIWTSKSIHGINYLQLNDQGISVLKRTPELVNHLLKLVQDLNREKGEADGLEGK